MNDAAIKIEGLSKTFQRGKARRGDIRSSLSSWWKGIGKTEEEFYALRDIDLTIQQGDIVGIVGPNGAGKSTLLKLLSRITFPSQGRITINGTLSSMLEVGTGFHPELTGRENIFLNGSIIGMRREEISRKLDSIVAFSGLEDFLDTPVKHYSSGMYVRLAFSVASHLEPDILLIDEVLAVGDHDFRKKCMARLMNVSGEGRTIVIVSHQMNYLKELCQTGIYLNHGQIQYQGLINDTIHQYVHHYSKEKRMALEDRLDRRGSGNIRAIEFEMLDTSGFPLPVVSTGQEVVFRLQLKAEKEEHDVRVQIEFFDLYGQLSFIANNTFSNHSLSSIHGTKMMRCVIHKFPLNTGLYFVNLNIYANNILADEIMKIMEIDVEPGLYYETGKLPPPNKGLLVDYHWEHTP
jgi:lipopolysaccharide transport system ATP-binding protein